MRRTQNIQPSISVDVPVVFRFHRAKRVDFHFTLIAASKHIEIVFDEVTKERVKMGAGIL